MSPAQAKPIVNSVLAYLAGYIQFARLRNDLRTVQHFEECWALVFDKFFGGYRVVSIPRRYSYQEPVAGAPESRPRWFTEKYARPVRKVVGLTTERVADMGRAGYFSVVYAVLECGHKKESANALTGAPPEKHMRCKECAPQHNEMVTTGQPSRYPGNSRNANGRGDLALAGNPITCARRDFMEATA